MLTINQLTYIIAHVAGVEIVKKHVPSPQGVRGRNSDNYLLQKVLDYEPVILLESELAIFKLGLKSRKKIASLFLLDEAVEIFTYSKIYVKLSFNSTGQNL